MAACWSRENAPRDVTVGVVTGVGRALGAACARQLVDHVDTLLLTDPDPHAAMAAARELVEDADVAAEPFTLDLADDDGLARLTERITELGTLRGVAHADFRSPSLADSRQILGELVAAARLTEALRPLADNGTAMVVLAAMGPLLDPNAPDPAALAILDDPLNPEFPDRIRELLGPVLDEPARAHTWISRGVHRLVRRESVRLGAVGARICSVTPGIIDTPLIQLEAAEYPGIDRIVQRTPLRRKGYAEEVAAVVAFALSEQASFLNGTDLLVDGGACAAAAVGEPNGAGRAQVLAS
ncbi:SDR family oxidoreductase [Nocardia jiangxiensis]|uniref:SDR family oxidoreductase n=1 Tax=Nocardia jiangxiensis TaxID=282685 RepID=A0ABW6RWC6_9NOCA|nr:SDR family oxidoreductase [Nocardia jiangxiensis]